MDGTSLGLLGCSVLPGNRIVGSTTFEQDPKCDNWPQLLTEVVDAYRPAIVATMLGPWEMFDRETPNGREDAKSNQLTDQLEAQLARIDSIARKAGARLVILNTPCYNPAKIALGHAGRGLARQQSGRMAQPRAAPVRRPLARHLDRRPLGAVVSRRATDRTPVRQPVPQRRDALHRRRGSARLEMDRTSRRDARRDSTDSCAAPHHFVTTVNQTLLPSSPWTSLGELNGQRDNGEPGRRGASAYNR